MIRKSRLKAGNGGERMLRRCLNYAKSPEQMGGDVAKPQSITLTNLWDSLRWEATSLS